MEIDAVRAIIDGSKTLVNWDLTLFGGSLAIIVTTSHKRPNNTIRYLYLLFLPAWIFFAISLNYGSEIIGSGIMAELYFNKGNDFTSILYSVNDDYTRQLQFLEWGIVVIGIWLVAYLFWFVFFYKTKNDCSCRQ